MRAIACLCLGAFISYVSLILVNKVQNPSVKDLNVIVSIVLSAVIIQFSKFYENFLVYYFIGLFIGLLLFQIFQYLITIKQNKGETRSFINFLARK
jgi:hypothetical protein